MVSDPTFMWITGNIKVKGCVIDATLACITT